MKMTNMDDKLKHFFLHTLILKKSNNHNVVGEWMKLSGYISVNSLTTVSETVRAHELELGQIKTFFYHADKQFLNILSHSTKQNVKGRLSLSWD